MSSRELVDSITESFKYWFGGWINPYPHRAERSKLLVTLANAESFDEWQRTAERLDTIEGTLKWRQDPASSSYDYTLISSRYRRLLAARTSGNLDVVADIVRSGSLRNLASICEPNLYNYAYAGTKMLIEDYIAEVTHCLHLLAAPKLAEAEYAWQRQWRLDYFHDTRQSFGTTSLILHGGSLFGLCHIGTIKALLQAGLLPAVITGATVGAIVSAFVCSMPASDLSARLESLPGDMPNFDQDEYQTPYFGSVVEGVIRSRYPPEIVLFERYVYDTLGDMTFEESYLISGKALNIIVLSAEQATHPEQGRARLLNYLTAPRVIVRTAIRASIGSNVLPRVKNPLILAKDHEGNIVNYYDHEVEFLPANTACYSSARDSPYIRLAELFNVNNFIVSITRPYFAPLLLSDFKYRGQPRWFQHMIRLSRSSIQYRVGQLSNLGLVPQLITSLFLDENIPGGFQVNIVPEFDSILRTYALLFDSHNIGTKVDHWTKIGERSVWPMLSIIWARTAIEFTLDNLSYTLKNN